MTYKVAMSDSIFPDLSVENEVLSDIDSQIHLAKSESQEDILEVAKDADALLVVFANINRGIIERLDKCKVISRSGIGLDNIDIKAATEQGIQITYQPDYCMDEVSDHTLALALALNRRIKLYDTKVQNGGWGLEKQMPIHSLNGAKWGMIGFGKIAKLVAQKAQSFGCDVIAFDPYALKETAEKNRVEIVSMDYLLNNADVLSLHAPLNNETEHIIDKDALKAMKHNAYLINTSRGGLVDSHALAKALEERWIAGAGVDVMEEEPPSVDDPLLNLGENLIITPHIAFYSEEAKIILRKSAAREIVRVLSGKSPKNPVN